MNSIFILASKDFFFNKGLKEICLSNKTLKSFEFTNVQDVVKMSFEVPNVYFVCDVNAYYSYNKLLSKIRSDIVCITTKNIFLERGKLQIKDNGLIYFNLFDTVEKEILHLYFIQRLKTEDIAKKTNMTVRMVYNKINIIKNKLVNSPSGKLPFLLRVIFICEIKNIRLSS
ncbi:hypothetical protein Q5512_25435 [Escherichia coli]|nr:hypothetical protein [Escherichia coli]